jgi:hypothetical protein
MENEAVIKRLEKKIDPAKEKILNVKNRDLEEDDIKELFVDIVSGVFGFKKESEIFDLKSIEKSFFYIGTQIDDEIKYLIECSSPIKNFDDETINKAFEYGTKYHAEWIVKTNSIKWELYHSKCDEPNEYDLSCQFNFLDLDLKNNVDLEHLFLVCKEAHVKTSSTDPFNRCQWFGFLSKDKKTIEFMFLVSQCLYEDSSGKFHIPFLDVTYRCEVGLVARQNAMKALENYLKEENRKVYDSNHKFITVAYHKETEHMKRNQPVWW